LSLVRHRRIEPSAIWELKAGMLKKSGLLTLHRGHETFADLGGLEALKDFCRLALRPNRPAGVKPRGIMLVGIPGTGKSAFARALGNETNRPTLILDPRGLYGSLLGQTEQNLRHALKVADAMGGILYVDEIRDALAGGESSGKTDGGVTAGVLGTLQTWLADHTSDVFFVGSCNSLQGLPPQFTRAGRFNATFFFDYPDRRQREKIWPIYLRKFNLDPDQPRPPEECWTGAEIRSCCETAALLGLSLVDAAQYVIPVSISGAEEHHHLRQWAHGRCLSADVHGVYQCAAAGPIKPSRKIRRAEPLNN
jgi:SpoVK/Ycf46/Vps4 family AAA+-type ATPase